MRPRRSADPYQVSAKVDAAITSELLKLKPFIGEIARRAIAELMHVTGATGPYRVYVDGVLDAPEETVRIPGMIEYELPSKLEAVAWALSQVIARSPRGAGAKGGTRGFNEHFVDNWFVFVDGIPWTQSIVSIPPRAEVGIVNVSDYSRKIDVGGQRVTVPPHIVEDVRLLATRKFPAVLFERKFVNIPGGYILRGRQIKSGLSYNKKTGFTQARPPSADNRASTRKGQVMTYPALIVNMK